jgi:hypothetical protein
MDDSDGSGERKGQRWTPEVREYNWRRFRQNFNLPGLGVIIGVSASLFLYVR